MKKNAIFLFFLILTSSNFAARHDKDVIESYHIEDVEIYADKNSLVVFDLDDTLFINAFDTHKGLSFLPTKLTDESKKFLFDALVSKNVQKTLCSLKAKPNQHTIILLNQYYIRRIIELLLEGTYWKKSYPFIEPTLIEDTTPHLIDRLQKAKIPTIAFTGRSVKGHDFTKSELERLAIYFSLHGNLKKRVEKDIDSTIGYGYKNGLLMLKAQDRFNLDEVKNKGRVLIHFLESIKYKPKKIIFIDNDYDIVKSVISACNKAHVDVIGIWYRNSQTIEKRSLLPAEKKAFIDLMNKTNFWQLDDSIKDIKTYLDEQRSERGFFPFFSFSYKHPNLLNLG